MNNFRRSISSYSNEIKKNPTDSYNFVIRSCLYQSSKNYDLALKDINEALKLETDSETCCIMYLENRMTILFQMGKIYESLKDFEYLRKISPNGCFLCWKQAIHDKIAEIEKKKHFSYWK